MPVGVKHTHRIAAMESSKQTGSEIADSTWKKASAFYRYTSLSCETRKDFIWPLRFLKS